MSPALQFDHVKHLLSGPGGSLPVPPTDLLAHRLLMLIEGESLDQNISAVAQRYGYCRQRYYQLLAKFKRGGSPALQPDKTGPKSNYRRTDQAVRQVLRYLFLDPEASAEVITQRLRQTHFTISLRSVQRVIADYGLQKKTLCPQPPKPAAATLHPARRKTSSPSTRRRSKHRTPGSASLG